jgi:hypothetical protein
VYLLIILCMWGRFGFTSGLPYETAFPFMSETLGALGGFVYPADPLRPNTNTFYHAAYLLGEIVSPGSFVPYQIVYAALWLARGLLVFGILKRLLPHATWLAYTVGALTLVHASDGALQWVGQMNQFGFIFWMLLASYVFVVANDRKRLRPAAVAMLFVVACQYMSLWSYESGLFIMLLVPVAVVLMRWPLQRSGAILCAAWYVVPTVYMAATVARYYLHPSGRSYQEVVLRSDWSAVSLVNDLGFNVAASLSFWDWCHSAPVAVPLSAAAFLAFLAVAVFACGGMLIARAAHELEPAATEESAGVAAALICAGLSWIVVSFPAYLLLNSARSLWRTQLLSGPGAAMVFAGMATVLSTAVARRRAVRAISLALAAIVVYHGAACAVQRGGLHEQNWQSHRRGIVALLRAVPQVTPGTIIVMTNVPKERDPFRHAYWFDLAMRLAYPKTPVSGIYFFANGSAAPGNSLTVTDGRWQWDGKSAAPLVREGGLDQTIVVQYGTDGVGVLLDRFPEFLCPEPCPANTYAPRIRIAGTAPSSRVVHRYGPL